MPALVDKSPSGDGGALACALRRTEIVTAMPVTAQSAVELSDALYMAAECATAAGDLRGARQLAERIRDS
jgi:hypothetical protein